MKTLGLKMVGLFLMLGTGMAVQGQTVEREVPGDDFSLEGALELFKKSASPEEFEKLLNVENSKVNNLDLNGDGYIDYIRVIDRNEGNVHTFTLQAVISENELQDVAVIELEKQANGKAVLQIIGDEDVYGMETIIEPTREVRVNAGTTVTTTYINVWDWPSVQYVYSPSYVVWISPWGWRARPVWWSTWRPVTYYHYHSYWRPYRPYYTHCYTHRVVYADRIYRPHRSSSVIVRNRHESQLTRYRTANRGEIQRRRSYDRRDDDRRTANRDRSRYEHNGDVRKRDGNTQRERSNSPTVDNRRTEQPRPRANRETPESRERVNTNRSAERERPEVKQRNERPEVKQRSETPSRRSGGEVNRERQSTQPRSKPEVRTERPGKSSAPRESRSSQPRKRG